jgi:hypothetical protein
MRMPCFDAGQFADAHLRAVHFDKDVFDEGRRSLAGAHTGELVFHDLLGLDHLLFRFEQNIVHGHSAETLPNPPPDV